MQVENFSRYCPKPRYALPELLCHFWAPMLLAAFRDRHLMTNLSDAHSTLAGVLLDRLVDILNECSLHPYDAAGLLALYKAAKSRQVTVFLGRGCWIGFCFRAAMLALDR
jgi:hypothetical protein